MRQSDPVGKTSRRLQARLRKARRTQDPVARVGVSPACPSLSAVRSEMRRRDSRPRGCAYILRADDA
jgi:hypothetical protein